MSCIRSHTFKPTWLKFGTKTPLYLLPNFQSCTPNPGVEGPKTGSRGLYRPNSTISSKNFAWQPWKWWDGQVRLGPRPYKGVQQPVKTQLGLLQIWSLDHFGREMGTHPERSVPMFGLGTPTPRVGGPKYGVPGSMQAKPGFARVGMLQRLCSGLGLCSGYWKCTGHSRPLLFGDKSAPRNVKWL